MKRGFTLIELLVVIAIIGILSSVVLASLNSARGRAQDSKVQQDLRQVSTALQLYYDKHGSMPPNSGSSAVTLDAALSALVSEGFISSLPESPNAYSYRYYNYGPNNTAGAMVVGELRGGTAPATGYPGSCRPFSGSNWCRSDQASIFYCVCALH